MRVKQNAKKVTKKFTVKKDPGIRERNPSPYTIRIALPKSDPPGVSCEHCDPGPCRYIERYVCNIKARRC